MRPIECQYYDFSGKLVWSTNISHKMQNKRRKLQPIDAGELLSDIYNNDFPPELFHHIVSYISAYPYYVTLSRVSKQWRKELEEEIIVRK